MEEKINLLVKGLINKKLTWKEFLKLTTSFKTVKAESFSLNSLADLFHKLESNDLRVHTLVMGSGLYKKIEDSSSQSLFDPETKKSNFDKGLKGMIWGAQVYVTRKCPSQTIVALSEAEWKKRATLIIKD